MISLILKKYGQKGYYFTENLSKKPKPQLWIKNSNTYNPTLFSILQSAPTTILSVWNGDWGYTSAYHPFTCRSKRKYYKVISLPLAIQYFQLLSFHLYPLCGWGKLRHFFTPRFNPLFPSPSSYWLHFTHAHIHIRVSRCATTSVRIHGFCWGQEK